MTRPPAADAFRHEAMATVLQLWIAGALRREAEGAAREAFDLADRLERELSRYVQYSDIARLNRAPAGQPVAVGPEAFACLQRCQLLHRLTSGAFDPTVGPLVDLWRSAAREGRTPSDREIRRAALRVGLDQLQLDPGRRTVTLRRAPVTVDLGGVGKGYVLDRMVELLRRWELDRVLADAGHSTVLAWRAPPGDAGWPVTVRHPDTGRVLRRFRLVRRALSGSGLRKGPHIIDPRTGRPAGARRAAWCAAPAAAEADGLSTALMVMGDEEIQQLLERRPDVEAVLA